MTRVGIISQARMTSTRLPGKVLMQAGGKSMLEWHIERLRSAGYPIILATTTNVTDDPLVELADRLGVEVFRGSEDDVLSRFAGAAEKFELDVVVRVTSDCPLIDGDVVAAGVQRHIDSGGSTYVSNIIDRTYPRGFDFEVFSAEALKSAQESATDASDREHVTPYVRRHTSPDQVLDEKRDADASSFRVTLDTDDDFEVISRLFNQYGAGVLNADQVISVLESHPELVALNAHVEQKKVGE